MSACCGVDAIVFGQTSTSTAPELLHIVCCDDNEALCGQDVTEDQWAEDGDYCIPCEIEFELGPPCPVTGCMRERMGP